MMIAVLLLCLCWPATTIANPVLKEKMGINLAPKPDPAVDSADGLAVAVETLNTLNPVDCDLASFNTETFPDEIQSGNNAHTTILRRLTRICPVAGPADAPKPDSGTIPVSIPTPDEQAPSSTLDLSCSSANEQLVTCTGPEIDATSNIIPLVLNCLWGMATLQSRRKPWWHIGPVARYCCEQFQGLYPRYAALACKKITPEIEIPKWPFDRLRQFENRNNN